MRLRSVYLQNFRSFEEKQFSFAPKVNIICGPNARGKTSLLEAIHLFVAGRSFRASKLHELIRHGADFFYIEMVFEKHGVEQKVSMSYDGKQRKVVHNRTSFPTLNSLIGMIPGTVMVPDDIDIVKGSPSSRRGFLDLQIVQEDPLYVHHLIRYNKAVRHRNLLLKEKNFQTIELWEEELAKAAAYIVPKRYRTIRELEKYGSLALLQLSGAQEEMRLHYKSPCQEEEEDPHLFFLQQYRQSRPKELRYGSTTTGPHHDDFQLSISNKDARYFASEGQQRSCAVSLRFAEWSRLKGCIEMFPLLLIDDIGGSFDQSRKERLSCLFQDANQVLVTTTEEFQDPATHLIRL